MEGRQTLTQRTAIVLSSLVASGVGAMVVGIHMLGASTEARAQGFSVSPSSSVRAERARDAPHVVRRLATESRHPADARRQNDLAETPTAPVTAPRELADVVAGAQPLQATPAESDDDLTGELDEPVGADDSLGDAEGAPEHEETEESEDDDGEPDDDATEGSGLPVPEATSDDEADD